MDVIDMTGRVFGRLTVLRQGPYKVSMPSGFRTAAWICRCECGKEVLVRGNVLRGGWSTHCGCQFGPRHDYSGQKFGLLTAIKRLESGKWLFRCECGNTKEAYPSTALHGHAKSCGCLRKRPPGMSAARNVYNIYRNSFRSKGYQFDLELDEFLRVASGNCHYCGAAPKQTWKYGHRNEGYTHNGVVRLDRSKPFVKENCVPSCKACTYNRRKEKRKIK